mgnify:CR=1 FL=1
MASLTEVYDGHLRTVTTSRRVSLGAGLFALGAAMVVGSIAVATTTLGAQFGFDRIAARRLAGVLAGLGLPATVLGVFAVLPAGRTTRAASVIGASVTVFGVALFWVAYPDQWFGTGNPFAAVTAVVYFAGAMTTLSCLFAALATFKTRTDPGGTARMEITEEGGVRLVEDADPVPGFGSVGMFGTDPDGDVSTQTNRESPPEPRDEGDGGAEIIADDAAAGRDSRSSRGSGSGRGSRSGRSGSPASGPGASPTADGGSATVDGGASGADTGPTRNDAEFLDAASERGRPDAYCGNCEHFEYVKVDEKITPYCGLRAELMDDMDACSEWSDAS